MAGPNLSPSPALPLPHSLSPSLHVSLDPTGVRGPYELRVYFFTHTLTHKTRQYYISFTFSDVNPQTQSSSYRSDCMQTHIGMPW